MEPVLTTGAILKCAHAGTGKPASSAKLSVGGIPVVARTGVPGTALAGCTQQPSTAQPNNVPCAAVSTATGQSLKLTVGGQPVALKSLTGTTNGAPVNSLSAELTPGKLRA